MKKFEISEDLANKILSYLASKPWIEADLLITELKQIQEITTQVKPLKVEEDTIEK